VRSCQWLPVEYGARAIVNAADRFSESKLPRHSPTDPTGAREKGSQFRFLKNRGLLTSPSSVRSCQWLSVEYGTRAIVTPPTESELTAAQP
jgi:hypothetical protein